MNKDFSQIRPYGDTMDDGMVQLSFTLPVTLSDQAQEGARLLALEMGLEEPSVVYSADLGEDFSFYIVYARTRKAVDLTQITVKKANNRTMSKAEVDQAIETKLKRKLKVIGACIESDAHTVGIDAIMNMKGYNGHKGLEAYHNFEAYNLGAQVSSEDVVVKARELQADAILVSQIVTQKNIHLANLTRMVELLEAEGLREQVILIVGGPRISHPLAKELGYDAGFGSGTYAEDVASFIVQRLIDRRVDQPNK